MYILLKYYKLACWGGFRKKKLEKNDCITIDSQETPNRKYPNFAKYFQTNS